MACEPQPYRPLQPLRAAEVSPAAQPTWPEDSASLVLLPISGPPQARVKVYIDPGHGAPRNIGNLSATCRREMDVTLDTSERLAEFLEGLGWFEVKLGRTSDRRVRYQSRVAEANRWGADVFLSIHTDNRGTPSTWTPPGHAEPCSFLDSERGISVLYSDEGGAALAYSRESLAVTLGKRMVEAGFHPYDGAYYETMYDANLTQGVFVSRHKPGRRIYVLRTPKMASAIIETHNSWYLDEEKRWDEDHTHEAFGRAVANALLDFAAP